MTKQIVVPVDGSPVAERALAPAAWLARGLAVPARVVKTTFEAETDAEADERYLAGLAEQMGLANAGSELIRARFAGTGLIEALAAMDDPAVCMSTRGKSGFMEVLLGSVSDELLRGASSPVMLVGPKCAPGEPTSSNVVVSVDGSELSRIVYPVLADWTQRLGLSVHLVTVAQTGTADPADSREVAAQLVIDDATRELKALGVDAEPHILNGADPAELVVAFAAALPAALIAVGTHGHGGALSKAMGSVANEIVRHATCPVLVRRIPA